MPAADPRPLTGEPLALDLVNTEWIDDAGAHDLLDDPAATRGWLAGHGLPDAAPARAVAHLRTARAAMRAVLERPEDPAGVEAFDGILARGRVRLTYGGRPGEEVDASDAWRPAWIAARDLLRLLGDRPARVRSCANPECVLWFEDATRSGTRRWCSMSGCGNRLKARRHYARRRPGAG